MPKRGSFARRRYPMFVCTAYFPSRRFRLRTIVPIPTNPVPRRSNVPGSGTGAKAKLSARPPAKPSPLLISNTKVVMGVELLTQHAQKRRA